MVLSQNAARRQSYLLRHNFSQFMPPQALQALRLYQFADGEALCRESLPIPYLQFLVDGHCKVSRCLRNGQESLICFYQDFAILGELELICPSGPEGCLSINTAQAIGPVWCLSLPMEKARSLLLEDPRALRFLCSRLSQKLIDSNRNLSISLHYPVEQRLASYIVCSLQDDWSLPFRANHTHLAKYLGCSHRQLLRVLRRFQEEGLLQKEAQGYRILDPARLESLAGDIYYPYSP